MSILNISLAIFLTEMFNKNYPPPPKKWKTHKSYAQF